MIVSLQLDGKAFSTTTGTRGIRVVEVEPFTIQTSGELQGGIAQVQETAQVRHHFHSIIFKNLVVRPRLIVEVHLVSQTRTTTTRHGHPNKVIFAEIILFFNFSDSLLSTIGYKKQICILCYLILNCNYDNYSYLRKVVSR